MAPLTLKALDMVGFFFTLVILPVIYLDSDSIWLLRILNDQNIRACPRGVQAESSTSLCPLSQESDCDPCCRGDSFAKTGHLSKLLTPQASLCSRGMPGLHHEVFIGKDNAMPMAAPGHHSYTWPFHKPAKNLWWVAAENVMRRQWFQAKPKEGITTRLAQRDSYASRSNTYITWARALFASNRFLWRYTRMGSSQQISVAAEQT